METIGVGVLGCGVVGAAVVRGLLRDEADGRSALRLTAVAVKDPSKARPYAIPPRMLSGHAIEVVEDPTVDIVCEVVGGLAPARSWISRALELGKPVVTANKALLGAAGPELRALATDVPLLSEGAVGGAVPILRTLAGLVDGDRIVKLEGVLNGTANHVLSTMERTGSPLDAAVAEARALGYAEADPARDLDGRDTADKLAVLCQHAFGEPRRSSDIPTRGIQDLTSGDVEREASRGRRWRLVATAVEGCANVGAVPLPMEHPLARLTGPENGVLVTSERAGQLLLCGAGAGADPTASAVLSDLVSASRWICSTAFASGPT